MKLLTGDELTRELRVAQTAMNLSLGVFFGAFFSRSTDLWVAGILLGFTISQIGVIWYRSRLLPRK